MRVRRYMRVLNGLRVFEVLTFDAFERFKNMVTMDTKVK